MNDHVNVTLFIDPDGGTPANDTSIPCDNGRSFDAMPPIRVCQICRLMLNPQKAA
jgi:hypothetical protein